MTRLTIALLMLVLAVPTLAGAQSDARRRVRPGEVTGLEMAIDGSLVARPGGRVRWFVTLYEVLRRRDLRPSPRSTLRVTSSAQRAAPVAEVTTDAQGRASLEIPIPEWGAPDVRVEAVSPRGVRRVFSVELRDAPRSVVELYVDRAAVPPGATVTAFGRVLDRVTGAPVAGADVTIQATGRGPLAPRERRTTDAAGVFATTIAVRDEPTVRISASAPDAAGATETVTVAAADVAPLWVTVTPSRRVAEPGAVVTVDVRVRTPEGQPVPNAEVDWIDARRSPEERAPRTDAAGEARLRWPLPAVAESGAQRRTRSLRVVDPARGTVVEEIAVRVARDPVIVGFAVGGGALAPGLEGAVFVRAVAPDGAPIAGRELTLEVSRLDGPLTATTSAEGVAVFRGTFLRPRGAGEESGVDGCGGPTLAEATLVVGDHREAMCLPVDPDATLAIVAAPTSVDGVVTFEVARRGLVSGSPVEVTALASSPAGWIPVARATLEPTEREGALALPPDALGRIWLRARPILADGRAGRGGGRLIYRAPPAAPLALAADERAAHVEGTGGTVAVFAMDAERADALEARIDARLGPVGAAIARGRGDAWIEGLLASLTPRDVAASFTTREGQLVVQPLPQEPVAQGLLRDPWRTRARFVRGRVGRMMRAVEDYVATHVPSDLEEVAVREGRGHRFNRAVLDAALASAGLGDETVASLDGEPLDIEALAAMDPSFDYDHVARRITRERLFRVLVFLRRLVDERELDRPWARRGDPSLLLPSILEVGSVSWGAEWPERDHLFDAWGRPFELRRVRGRARFSFLEPVDGWALVSVGPDGRAGSADDVVDPFARVLPSGGLYAEAVGEDVLLARLDGVALGRATVASLVEAFEMTLPHYELADAAAASDGGWDSLPAPLADEDAPPPMPPHRASIGGLDDARAWELPPERRTYAAVAVRFGPDGALSSARDAFVAGAPWIARLELPRTLRPGERLRVPLILVRLADAPPPEVEVHAASDALLARLEGGGLVLEARRSGLVELNVRVRSEGWAVGDFTQRVRIVPSGGLRARHVGTVGAETSLAVHAPAGVTPWRGVAVVGAPRALVGDPIFAGVRERHPAVVAWARAMAGDEVDSALMVSSLRTHEGSLESACALVAWLIADEDGAPVGATTSRLVAGVSDDLSGRAAILAALAPAAPGGPGGGGDPMEQLLAGLRQDGWRALATATDRPSVMARVAAALLLADRRDGPGRALLERATERLETDAHGRRWVPGDPARPGDEWVGTLALAIAARQVGDDALADELARVAVGRLYLVDRLGAEGAFWAAAASVYGAFGVDAPEHVQLTVDGARRRVRLADGVAVVPIPPTAELSVRSDRPVWLRLESRYLVPHGVRDEGPLRTRIEGTPGRRGERAGLELAVENAADDDAPHPVVELTLPGAAILDEDGRRSMERAAAVRRVEAPDPAGVVRLHLAPLAGRGTHLIPLPIRWLASGRTRGLATAAYDAGAPRAIATSPEQTLTIEEGP